MARDLESIPLFPLNAVLFPYAHLHLHIFEERYREMVNECLDFEKPFGIVLIRSGSETGDADPYLVGTAVRIVGSHRYEDGRMDIQVQGERRFRIREFDDSRSFLVGLVEPVFEAAVEEDARHDQLMDQIRTDCELFVQRRFENQGFAVKVAFPADPVALSFTVANLLTLDNLMKQSLLETTDTFDRIERILPILASQMIEAPASSIYPLTSVHLREWVFPN